MNLFDYLFVESCRICRKFIVDSSSQAKTLCADCWAPLAAQTAQLDSCAISNADSIMVAHATAYEKTMKQLIYKLKYDSDRLIAHDLGFLLVKAYLVLKEEMQANCITGEFTPQLVPVPLSQWRLIKRGFNQAEMLAKELKRRELLPVASKLLRRRKHTKAQHKLNKQERAFNLQNAFICSTEKIATKNADFILVDDIHTSGATLSEAAQTLLSAGANSVSAITVSRAILLH
ncbi:MAG: ComF family protein [Candidatus Obscuribacterales bacterium]|nr:ComF family protein [Candidatus Obscuribacterales bacterium]